MFDIKAIHAVLDSLEQERNIPREKVIEAIGSALATAYKKEFGRKSQIIRGNFDINSGKVEFFQIKIVVTQDSLRSDEDIEKIKADREVGIELSADQEELLATKLTP